MHVHVCTSKFLCPCIFIHMYMYISRHRKVEFQTIKLCGVGTCTCMFQITCTIYMYIVCQKLIVLLIIAFMSWNSWLALGYTMYNSYTQVLMILAKLNSSNFFNSDLCMCNNWLCLFVSYVHIRIWYGMVQSLQAVIVTFSTVAFQFPDFWHQFWIIFYMPHPLLIKLPVMYMHGLNGQTSHRLVLDSKQNHRCMGLYMYMYMYLCRGVIGTSDRAMVGSLTKLKCYHCVILILFPHARNLCAKPYKIRTKAYTWRL